MPDLDLKTLRLLVAVSDLRSIARAAEQEHIEPSAISKRIAQLEATLGTPVLARHRRGVEVTPAGAALLEHARSILFSVDRIERDVAALGVAGRGQVRLLASASAIAESLLDDLAAFMRVPSNRDIQVDMEERISTDLVRELRDGSAALGVCWDHTPLDGLEQRPYRRDRLALAVPADHPLAAHRALRFEQTLDHDHVGLAPSTAVHTMLRRSAARSGHTVRYRVIVSNFDAALRVVAAGLGVSVIPAQVAANAAGLGIRVVALRDAWADRQFVVCYRRFDALQAAARRLVDHLSAAAAT
jgi:DNA-binding transcriptional LysR family regulator